MADLLHVTVARLTAMEAARDGRVWHRPAAGTIPAHTDWHPTTGIRHEITHTAAELLTAHLAETVRSNDDQWRLLRPTAAGGSWLTQARRIAAAQWPERAAAHLWDPVAGIPYGPCADRRDHTAHLHCSDTAGWLWCRADQTARLPHAAERRRRTAGATT